MTELQVIEAFEEAAGAADAASGPKEFPALSADMVMRLCAIARRSVHGTSRSLRTGPPCIECGFRFPDTPQSEWTEADVADVAEHQQRHQPDSARVSAAPCTDAFADKWDSYNFPLEAVDFASRLERYCHYYREILRRIAGGWETPKTLAGMALVWEIHKDGCATRRDEGADCNCRPVLSFN